MSDRFPPEVIALARELRLPREFREGDWYLRTGVPRCWSNVHGDPLTSWVTYPWPVVWLPSVEDCLDLLREAGCGWVRLESSRTGCEATTVRNGQDVLVGHGATPLEALYRLLLECGIGQTTANSKED